MADEEDSGRSTRDDGPEPEPTDPDWLLQSVVAMVNQEDMEFPVSLNVNGVTVSGYLIGGKAYFERLADHLEEMVAGSSDDEGIASEFGDSFREFRDTYEKGDVEEEESSSPHFIHLREALVVSPSGHIPKKKPFLWRGRISSVDGFSFERIEWT